jgi:hypothetical protein
VTDGGTTTNVQYFGLGATAFWLLVIVVLVVLVLVALAASGRLSRPPTY